MQLNLILSLKNRNQFQGLAIKGQILKFWKTLYVSDAEWRQESNGAISFLLVKQNSQKSHFWWRHNLA